MAALALSAFLPAEPGHAQVFHFQDTTTTLQLTTAQTPAHWYLEIYNDVGVDTTLRWKALFSNIPASWTVQLDVQTAIFSNIQSGDSADFLLKDSMPLPQKLIIGAFTNNTPATGSIYFDIYDPAAPAAKVTIEYYFIITPAVSVQPHGIAETVLFASDAVFFSATRPTLFRICNAGGRCLREGVAGPGWQALPRLPAGVYVVEWNSPAGWHRRRLVMSNPG